MGAQQRRTIRVGTASWTDPTLTKGSDWYPRRSMSAEERLRFYASVFTVVEVDATYYYPPNEHVVGLWVERTPDDFRFDIKAYSLLTQHPAKADSVWEDVAARLPAEHRDKRRVYLEHLPEDAADLAFEHYAEALRPLYSAGKLGGVFFQMPPWFVPSRANRRYVESLPDRLGEYDLAIEFRHRSWMEADAATRTLGLLERCGLAYVCVDGPQGFKSSIPPVTAVTADLAVVRFHGHNAENWEKPGIGPAERFRYLYSPDELAAWAPKVTALAEQAGETHALFNNCYADYGVRNARQLALQLNAGLQPGAPETPAA